MPRRDLNAMIGLLYDAAMSPGLWRGALTRISSELDCCGAQFYLFDKSAGVLPFSVASDKYTEEDHRLYSTYYVKIDERMPQTQRSPVGVWQFCTEMITEEVVRRSEFFNDFLLPRDTRYAVGLRLFETPTHNAGFAFHRSPKQGPFQRGDTRFLDLLLPHIQRAARIQQTLMQAELERQLVRDGLDRLTAGVAIVDAAGRVVLANAAASVLLEAGDGLGLHMGRLSACRADETARLRRALEALARGHAARPPHSELLTVTRPSGRRALVVLAVRLSPASVFSTGEPLAFVMIVDPETASLPSPAQLRALYGLTPAEAQLALQLASGKRLDEIAKAHGVSVTTVRTQLRAVLDKTETHRQAELVALLLRLPALQAARPG